MDILQKLRLTREHAECPDCGNDMLGNGEGTLIIEDNTFERTCKCGWLEYQSGGRETMTVEELIEELQTLNPKATPYWFDEYGNKRFISSIDEIDGETTFDLDYEEE
ncbi:DUF3797 domain-containing protein [Bacillus mycoides]|uniref:DUF3797 domain-containing protein n=1 Tax=Bacillus mycoides TaxID=1405 RepID=UPI003D081B02